MSELPKGWFKTQLGKLIELKYGKSLPANLRDGNGFPVYGSNGVVGFHSIPLVKGGGLIIGRKGSFGEVHICEQDFSPIDTTYYVDEIPCGNKKYWFYQLFKLPLNKLNRSTAIPGLNRDDAYEQEILLPPEKEQTRIVEKLDEVLAQVDTIKARLDGIPAILKRFRQSVLAAAVSGRLTEEWRKVHQSNDWIVATIGDIAEVATGKTPKRSESKYWDDASVPWLTSSATGDLFCTSSEQFVSSLAVKDCNLKVFKPGTLLLAMYGEGKTRGQVTELKVEASCNQACAAIIINIEIALVSYVKIRLLENYEETRKVAAGGNQPNLNLNKVREISIKLPEIEEQKEIVRLVDQYFAFADTIEAQVKKAQSRVDNLTQSILAKAFRGELVAQDPDDEPAEKLLERIAQARKEAEALAKAAKKVTKTK